MEWFILFIVNWVIFFLFIDWKKLVYNLWSGIVAILMQLMVDTNAISHEFYVINRPMLEFLGSSVFFILGPVFVIGVLISQFHPVRRWLRIVNVFVFMLAYSAQELLLLSAGALEYKQWHFVDSLGVNIGAMIIISWFSVVVLKQRGTSWT